MRRDGGKIAGKISEDHRRETSGMAQEKPLVDKRLIRYPLFH
jgi:hypothetical protein